MSDNVVDVGRSPPVEDVEMDDDPSIKRRGRGFNVRGKAPAADGVKSSNFDSLDTEMERGDSHAAKSVQGWVVIVTGVHEEATESDVVDKFADFGDVKDIHLNLDRRTGYVKGYALLEFETQDEAQAAIDACTNGLTLMDEPVKADFAFVKPPQGASAARAGSGVGRRAQAAAGRDRSRTPPKSSRIIYLRFLCNCNNSPGNHSAPFSSLSNVQPSELAGIISFGCNHPTATMDEETVLPIPNLKLQQHLFLLSQHGSYLSASAKQESQKALLDGIEKDDMAPYYQAILAEPSLKGLIKEDTVLVQKLESKNKEELQKLDEKQKEVEENEGEMEINGVLRQRAAYYAKIGDKEKAIEAHNLAISKGAGLGSKLDLTLTKVRIGLFFGDTDLVIPSIAEAKKLVEEGGDWDRRNRLKVYEGLHLMSIRDFKAGGQLFLEALSTFTATELLDYKDFITLTVLANALVLKRTDLKKKIIDSPEVLQVIDEIPHLRAYVTSLYACEYGNFFRALAEVEQAHVLSSRVLYQHARYYVREMRIIAYSQLLESYQSLSIDNMATAFGVSGDFIDSELSRFISAGRLPAVIDKVNGIVETRRPDHKNAQYAKIIKEGDVLLNSLQKLSRTAL
ncbi:PCI-domain-containing protein [Testicularia cyperi]|uniref:PCI-domain-containing protein n=1 Tax=Testicularia cyperi TaxID=1882483 RepID=A0A317XL00_9BASI|nr:PCI-domain-containing protein [Testicularia cyperi]